jgi:hypothetical protein
VTAVVIVLSLSQVPNAAVAQPVERGHAVAEAAGSTPARRSDCIPRLRRAIVERRAAAWRHQDALERPHTATARRARASTSCAYLRWVRGLWALRADALWERWSLLQRDVVAAIRFVFGPRDAGDAIAVSWCEGRHNTRAANGQFLGTFQMGEDERRRYGHGSTALDQVRAAHRYFVATGRTWGPWQCRPWGLAW